MSAAKMQHCDYCGAELGVYEWSYHDGPQSCGKLECERYVRDEIRGQEEQARYDAEQDGYSLYGGPGRW